MQVVVYGAGPGPDLIAALLERGYAISRQRNGPVAVPGQGAVAVVGDFGGSIPAHEANGHTARFWDLAETDASVIPDAIDAFRSEQQPAMGGQWKPWFPVIDYSRCTNCMQCLSFCLFDVYGVSAEGKIQVRNQSNCKTDCPACSRVCPEVAIMFPKYRHGPINGDEVSVDDVRREAMKIDISALLGGDLYSMLRDRSAKAKSRFSKERDDERALKERQNCLLKLGQQMGVPAEVLASLPSADEIRERAERARQAAAAATAQAHGRGGS
jgi:Pyruvate/2-oxoacid:ferredoxin oxidoreductase delta subunit